MAPVEFALLDQRETRSPSVIPTIIAFLFDWSRTPTLSA
jgi:hypothetical protein